MLEAKKISKFSFNLPVSTMAIKPCTIHAGSTDCAALDRLFYDNPKIDHVVIIKDEKPVSILTRLFFYSILGGRYGYALFQKKYIDAIADYKILCVNENTDLRTVSSLAMGRNPRQLYDPVIVVDDTGYFVGTVTMKQVINNAFDLEIKIATSANPLTHLPGNLIIGFWLEELLQEGRFSVLYCDLDHFKEYNDTYGFARGDEVLKFTAKLLSVFAENIPDTKLGHIGGDDFIIVSQNTIEKNVLQELCMDFDRKIKDFFSSKHADQGFYHALSRQGKKITIPLISLSIAVITEDNFNGTPHPGQLGQVAAILKKTG
jgi:diguanylate cyclase (GGDEF)-like protein